MPIREITVETTWTARHTFRVLDTWEAPNEGALELGRDIDGEPIVEGLTVDAATAELVDWRVL